MAAFYCWIPLSLLSFALNEVVDGCTPNDTPWSNMCAATCDYSFDNEVYMSNCDTTTLPSRSGSESEGDENLCVFFEDSRIKNVSSYAFSNFTANQLNLWYTFENIEPDAFNGATIEWLHIKHNPNLTSLLSGVFRGISGLLELSIQENYNLKSLPGDIFSGLTSLTGLTLQGNNLKSLPGNIFSGLTSLTGGLSLYNNYLTSLPHDIFHGLDHIGGLDLTGNFISCFDQDLFRPVGSFNWLDINQDVETEGLCPQTLKGITVTYTDINEASYPCVLACSQGRNQGDCNCSSYEGCVTCPDATTTVTEAESTTETTMAVADLS